MSAIDFQKLRREEKKRFRQTKIECLQEEQSGSHSDGGEDHRGYHNHNHNYHHHHTNHDDDNPTTTTTITTITTTTTRNTTSPPHTKRSVGVRSIHSMGEMRESVPPPWQSKFYTADTVLTVPSLDRQIHCVCSDPRSIFYLQQFLPETFGQELWEWLHQLPTAPTPPVIAHPRPSNHPTNHHHDVPNGCWHVMTHAKRKVALWDNPNLFPTPLRLVVDALIRAKVFQAPCGDHQDGTHQHNEGWITPNHILINQYSPEQGILPHTDGPAYASRTATISLGEGGVVLRFTPRSSRHSSPDVESGPSVVLHGRGSLVVFEDDAYLDYMHGIHENVWEEVITTKNGTSTVGEGEGNSTCINVIRRQPRISITVRHCKKI